MATTPECTFRVPLVDFRRAVASVRPHADRTKSGDDLTAYGRVRLIAGAEELLLVATNGTTAAMAAVEIIEGSDSRAERFAADDGAFTLDMAPVLLGDIRDGLRMQRGDVIESDQVAELTFTDGAIAARDVSGLWPDSQTIRPVLPFSTQYPNVRKMIAEAMAITMQALKPLSAGPEEELFDEARKQYARPLRKEPIGPAGMRGFIVLCGPRFIGLVSSGHDDGDSLARVEAERMRHLERLGLGVQETLELAEL